MSQNYWNKGIVSAVLVAIGTLAAVSNSQTEHGNNSCTADYETLEKVVLGDRRNVYKLSTTFIPPNVDSPLYVTVTYSFPNTSVKYVWSTISLYLTIHPKIIRYLSLFFCYAADDRIVDLELQLPEECTDLANNTAMDERNMLIVLTQRLQTHAQYSNKYTLRDGFVRAAETENVVSSLFSLMLVMPIISLLLCWFYAYGTRAYLRRHVNNSDNFPAIAALYWIGLTFVVFVVSMDLVTLFESSNHQSVRLQEFQSKIIFVVVIIEILSLVMSFLTTLFLICSNLPDCACFSHYTHVVGKGVVLRVFKIFFCGIFCCADITVNEAKLWLCLGGLFPVIICASSHIGFVIGGWISHVESSIVMTLFYMFIFTFQFWALQHVYIFSITFLNFCKKVRRKGMVLKKYLLRNEHDEKRYDIEWAAYRESIKNYGFVTTALLVMFVAVIFIDGFIFLIGYGIFLPSLESIDNALIRVYTIGQYIFTFAFFLLTYKLFRAGTGSSLQQQLISGNIMKFWRFLNRGNTDHNKLCVKTLHLHVKCLWFTVQMFERDTCTVEMKIKCLQRKQSVNKLNEAQQCFAIAKRELQVQQRNDASHKEFFTHLIESATEIEKVIDRVKKETPSLDGLGVFVKASMEKLGKAVTFRQPVNPPNKKAMKHLFICVNILREVIKSTLQNDCDEIPLMYLDKDKTDALIAALIFQKTNTSYEENENYSFLLSLIESDLI